MKNFTKNRNSGISNTNSYIWIAIVIGALLILIFLIGRMISPRNYAQTETDANQNQSASIEKDTTRDQSTKYEVNRVIDGDTIEVKIGNTLQKVRFIGVNTPETVDPDTPQECFGREASEYTKKLLAGKQVELEEDQSQGDKDKYGRLLRYVNLDGENVNLKIISDGYAYEYTYNVPYKYQDQFKKAQEYASENNLGLWHPEACKSSISSNDPGSNCNIKGNISASGEKIYHVPGQRYYDATQIDTSAGERWFCSEAEAQAVGWRKSKV